MTRALALLGVFALVRACGLNPQPEPPLTPGGDAASGVGGTGQGGTGAGGTGAGGYGGSGANGTGGSGGVFTGPDGSAGLPGVGDASGDAAAFDCASAAPDASPVAGTCIVFPKQKTTFTLAEVAAGISIDYDLVVDVDSASFSNAPIDSGGCGIDSVGGLYDTESIGDGAQYYCDCDQGLCAQKTPVTLTLPRGAYAGAFPWDGVNWTGPSDFGNPKGAAFPPGKYTLTVRTSGGPTGTLELTLVQ